MHIPHNTCSRLFSRQFIIFTVFISIILSICNKPLLAQKKERDPSDSVKYHSPKKAALYSALIPGLGQAYNKKYWKIPVIYAGLGVLGYFIVDNSKEYIKYRDAYAYRTDGDPSTLDDFPKYSEDNLLTLKNYWRRNMELAYIFTAGLYILNIVDASIDAHFFTFDVSEDLSLSIQPALNLHRLHLNTPATGMKITMKF